jgi:type IV secretion system protein VirD4
MELGIVIAFFFLLIAAAQDRTKAAKRKLFEDAIDFQPEVIVNEGNKRSARWADEKKLKKAGLFGGKGIRIGYGPDSGRLMRWGDADGHACLIAPTGMGKGTNILIPNLLSGLDDTSVVVVDPKGELAAVSGHYRKRLGPVFVLNPYRILLPELKGLKQARFNSMSRLNPKDTVNFGPLSAKQADAIVWQDEIGSESKHWSKNARKLIHGLIMALVTDNGTPKERKNLVRVAEIISTGEVYEFCREMMRKTSDPFIRQRLAKFAVDPAKVNNKGELASIVSTADTEVDFLADAAIADSLNASDFQFADLKKRVCTVYIVLPLDYLEIASRYFRLLVSCALSELIDPSARGNVRTVMLLDEFYQYGALSAVDNAFRMARGARVQLFPVVTGISDLQARYPHTWRSFLGNSAVRIFMSAQDDETARYMSEECGEMEVLSPSRNVRRDPRTGDVDVSDTTGTARQELLLRHQARSLPPHRMLVIVRGVGPVLAKRRAYFEDWALRGKARPNPYFKGGGGWLKSIFG